ncbi:MAG: ORF6N domain-containing protein [Tenericutes bacterium]|nr:ORF6N domain-containing protein [Mycoplasmatota bacterium]
MNEIIIKDKKIENMIFEVRGVQVMLSSDVAILYQIETRILNQVIKRNIDRFPSTFCFQLTDEEIDRLSLRSQFATLNKSNNLRGQHYKYLPYVLTEQGIMMLSGLLKSDIAVKVNIQIIDAFVKMRRYFANNFNTNELLLNHENRIQLLENTLDSFKEQKIKKIFFEGQIYDAYSILVDILNKARTEIIIIDNYASKELLDILKDINLKIIIVSKNVDSVLKEKYTKQYKNVEFLDNNSFHDRFIILDRSKLYTCGASFKDLGKKCLAISEFNDINYLEQIINTLNIN